MNDGLGALLGAGGGGWVAVRPVTGWRDEHGA